MKNISGVQIQEIRSSAPLRVNDIGGWTDTWFARKGAVLNLSIGPPVKIVIKVFEHEKKDNPIVLVHAKDYHESFRFDPINPDFKVHPIIQGAVNSVKLPPGIDLEITIESTFPAASSMGTSAAVCVALLGGLDGLFFSRLSPLEVVSLAHKVETVKLGLQSGIQDQIAAVYGGVCFIQMPSYPMASVEKLSLDENTKDQLKMRLVSVYLGNAHSSSNLHERVIRSLESGGPGLKQINRMATLAREAKNMLQAGDLFEYGRIMIENNECQRALHPDLISEKADAVIKIAKNFRAAGWKVNGAGGSGGSISLLGSLEKGERDKMLRKFDSMGRGIRVLPLYLSDKGLTVEKVTIDPML
ncbi:MAG: GHMP kinase [Candidatus Aminicenantes bacterium]|nr:GHMP kinase [Candidatus Aminicenantes bacterium]